MSDDSHRPPKFEWDYEVPHNAFWSNLNYSVGRNFLQCYTSSEISEMTFDENLSVDEKLDYLLRTLDNTLAKKETESAPIPLKDADHTTWRNILLGLSTIEHFAGNVDMEEGLTESDMRTNQEGLKISVNARIERYNGGDWEKRFKEGEEWLDGCRTRVDSMRKGKFAKYREAERKGVDQTLAALKEWREEHGGP